MKTKSELKDKFEQGVQEWRRSGTNADALITHLRVKMFGTFQESELVKLDVVELLNNNKEKKVVNNWTKMHEPRVDSTTTSNDENYIRFCERENVINEIGAQREKQKYSR